MSIDISKYLFVFEPSEHWDYCGGCIIVIASNFDEASRLLKDDEALHQNPNSTTYKHPSDVKSRDAHDCWVLTHQITIEPLHKPMVLVNNYNWD